MLRLLLLILGGALGTLARYGLNGVVSEHQTKHFPVVAVFPLGTLIINVTGSFILGLFLVWTTERVFADPKWRWLIAIGFCGSYTTFSSYAFETMAYFEQGHWSLFALNILTNNLLCLGGVLAGAAIARGI